MKIATLQQGIVVEIPKDAETWYTHANELMHQRQYETAINYYDRVLAIDPEFSLAWHYKGNCFDDLDSDTWYNKGISLKKEGKFDDAKTCIDKAIDLALGR